MAFDGSTGRLPVMSSKSMTPNEKTSDFSVNFPLDAYSGAKYLLISTYIYNIYVRPYYIHSNCLLIFNMALDEFQTIE